MWHNHWTIHNHNFWILNINALVVLIMEVFQSVMILLTFVSFFLGTLVVPEWSDSYINSFLFSTRTYILEYIPSKVELLVSLFLIYIHPSIYLGKLCTSSHFYSLDTTLTSSMLSTISSWCGICIISLLKSTSTGLQ